MTTTASRLCLLGLAIVFSGCSSTHDVEYYRAHADAREETIAGCRVSLEAFAKDQNCIAAMWAEPAASADFWKEHGEQRKEAVAECKNFLATIGKSDRCISAHKASIAAMSRAKPIYATDYKLPGL